MTTPVIPSTKWEQAVSQADRQGHQLWSLVTGVAEHDALIACSHLVEGVTGVVIGLIHALGDIRRLLVEGHQHSAAVGIKTTRFGAAVTDIGDHTPHQGVEVHPRSSGDLAGDQAEARVDHGFASHAAGWILLEQRIKNGIADLIADLVGMSLGDGFRGKDVPGHA